MTKQGFKTVSVSQNTIELLKHLAESRNETSASLDKLINVAVSESIQRGKWEVTIERLRLQHQHELDMKKLEIDSRFLLDERQRQDRIQDARAEGDLMATYLQAYLQANNQDDKTMFQQIVQMMLFRDALENRHDVSDLTPIMQEIVANIKPALSTTTPKYFCIKCPYITASKDEFVDHVSEYELQDYDYRVPRFVCPICQIETGASKDSLPKWETYCDWRKHVIELHKKENKP